MLFFIAHAWREHSDSPMELLHRIPYYYYFPSKCLPLPSVWGTEHYETGILCLCKKLLCFFFFSSCQGCFLSSWNIKKLDSVYDEQMLTRRFRNLGKHINPTDMPYFLPLCSWLWFLWSFACCSGCWSGLFVSSARSFWVSLDGLLVHMLVCFCLLCLDSYVCIF